MRKKYLFLLFGILFFNGIFAQEEAGGENEEVYYDDEYEEDEIELEKSMLVGINFQIGRPTGAFGENIDIIGWGFGGNLMWQFKSNPQLYAGLDFGFQNYDSESRINIFGFGEESELKTKNSMVLGHFQLRFYPKIDFFIKPYFEGMFGVKTFLTRTIETDLVTNETYNSQFDNSDFAWSMGGALGFEIPIQKKYLFLEGRVAYLKGTSGEYYARRPGNPNYFNPIEVFELKNSATDLILPQIGIKFLIGFAKNSDEEYEEEYYEDDEY